MGIHVECRSDHAYPGYPVAFYWHGERVEINKILAESHQPQGYTFQVRTIHQDIFCLSYDELTDEWSVEQA